MAEIIEILSPLSNIVAALATSLCGISVSREE